ncbi:hypothetical protein ACH4UM_01225 [Streptomyces sp. NPDC020801]|uniref:hypothetical protein n=1 Tax=unclassified Streptomyces TaxID=2593676 RepID=UPI0037A95490
MPGAALFLAVLGMLTAAVPAAVPAAAPAAAAPNPPPVPMTAADASAFALQWATDHDRITQARSLRTAVNPGGNRVTVGSMLDAANRQAHTQNNARCRAQVRAKGSALAGAHAVAYYCLQSDDANNSNWTPQGVSGTEDAQPGAGTVDGHRAIAFSWHAGGERPLPSDTGTRLSFLDRASTSNKYIHVLLVVPNSTGTGYSDVTVHAGGIVWYQHYVFVTANEGGVRVFDTDNLLQLANNPKGNISPNCPTGLQNGKYCGRGYHYLLPEIGRWSNTGAGTRYDSMSLERAPSGSVAFLTSEFRRNSVGRVARWTDSAMTRFQGTIHPYIAWHQPVRYVQGAFSRGCYYFNTGGGGGNRDLVRANTTGNRTPRSQLGGRGLQDLYWLRSANQLWTLTEHQGIHQRFLYGVNRPACP